jgi:serine protease Do
MILPSNKLQSLGILLLCVLFFCSATSPAQESPAGFFETGISASQPKMVKIFGASVGKVEGTSTGFLVSEEGHILTTQGVYLDGRQIRVILADGKEYRATVSRRDRITQLALLKIEAKTPDYFQLSEKPIGEIGDWVIAITNAFKVAEKNEPLSATLGVISLRTEMTARFNKRDVAYDGELVVIDAITSNPGAGGGAVITPKGELVGMVGKIISSSETNTRLNYAVPCHLLARFVNGSDEELEQTAQASIEKSELGIMLFKLGGRGNPAYVDRVRRSSPAAAAGLQPDDMIITLAGQKIGNNKEYQEALDTLPAGDEVIIIVKRGLEFLRIPITPVARK